VKKNN